MPDVLHLPIIFLVFNRPELTERVFARIREVRPTKLFVVADGPRSDRPGEAEKCRTVRELIERGIDWPCELVRDYSEVNLGCGRRVASGITNAFELIEEAIILEDDCLPDPTFFRFCAELLERYRDEQGVGVICGTNHQYGEVRGSKSYFFSRYCHVWGWATWRRAWKKFDYAMVDWPQWRDHGGVNQMFSRGTVRRFWRWTWNETFNGRIDTWDYRWTYSCLRHELLSVLPCRPLVQNIGFGPDATHTYSAAGFQEASCPMSFPLQCPSEITTDSSAEDRTASKEYSRRIVWARIVRRLLAKMRAFV